MRVAVAVELEPIFAEEAEERRLATLKRGDVKPVKGSGPLTEEGQARDQAAAAVGPSPAVEPLVPVQALEGPEAVPDGLAAEVHACPIQLQGRRTAVEGAGGDVELAGQVFLAGDEGTIVHVRQRAKAGQEPQR